MKEVNSGIELEKFLDALTQRRAKPDDWVQMSLRALHEIIETHRKKEREMQYELLMSCLPEDAENLSTLTDDQAGRLVKCFLKKHPWN